jgi:hypothetical protein
MAWLSPKNLRFWDNLTYVENNPFFATPPFSHNTTRSDFIEDWGVDCGSRQGYKVDVVMAPVSAANKHRAKLLENPIMVR